MRGLCVAVAQVVKVKAGCVAHRSEETEVTSRVSAEWSAEATAGAITETRATELASVHHKSDDQFPLPSLMLGCVSAIDGPG